MEKEYVLIKEKFNENFKQYNKHLKFFEKINNYETNYSNSYIDFFPYESIMNGYKPAFLFKNKPVSKKDENFIENRIKDNEIYYSYNAIHKEWGSEFYFTDKKNNKTRLFYTNDNDDEKMLLTQLYYKIMNGLFVESVYCYMNDFNMEEETFYLFEYKYTKENIEKIIWYNYFDKESKIIYDEKKLKLKK